MSAGLPENGSDWDVADGLSSVFGAAAASSLRNAQHREERVDPDVTYAETPAGGSADFIDSESFAVHAPETPEYEPSRDRSSGKSESTSVPVPDQKRAVHPAQVRDRSLIHALLLTAVKGCPVEQKLIDFIRENSDGVFLLPPGLVYRELHVLERERLIHVYRNGRDRRYTLTQAGDRVLKLRRRKWDDVSRGFTRLLAVIDGDNPRRVMV